MQTDNEKYNETVQPNTAFLNELKEKLPEFFTREGSFNLDKFRNQLKDKNINELSEGYQLDFIGKDYARRQAGEMPTTVIVPDEKQNKGEGKDSNNLFFTGDNLEVLRHLQNNYQNKIDVIYIDPPYNTGSDGFVYPDSFEYSDEQLKDMFGLDDDQVERLKSIQGKSNHSAWLTFMYPRLVLAKRLLTDKGVIFISIDDNEQADLRFACDEIFGEANLISQICHKSRASISNDKIVSNSHNQILLYAKNERLVFDSRKEIGTTPKLNGFNYQDGNGKYKLVPVDGPGGAKKGNPFYNFLGVSGYWRFSKERMQKMYDQGLIVKTDNNLQQKYYLSKAKKSRKTVDSWWDEKFYTSSATSRLSKLMGGNYFDTPKPVSLIIKMLQMFTCFNKNATVLDFFAGSSTTADAVMQLNSEDDGHRKFIMVQLPEKTYHINKDGKEVPTKGGQAAYDAGFRSIDQISRERIRRAAKKIREDNELTLPENFDGSFKHYRVVKPIKQTLENIEDFDPNNTNLFTNMVDGFSSQSLEVAGDTAGEDTILTTWLAKDGYSFDTNVEEIKFGNYTAHQVENNRLYLINEGWEADQTRELLNQLGTHQLEVQSVVLFGYSFNVAELRELENGLKQLDSKVTLIKRY
ncbi:site-specific DNA-methyltransferase [Lentilactobacillus parabuchneri]|uniref:site-specific DNA-methyltransferase n=1 Tax=Lentilactobacillus parabuchneri TaxID=152331 RepID=UPI001C4EEA7A|nr:site-specific DNA-methyltransferase [Lentilactobacillus parabuchneri]MBW0264847.1 site-specific DNA-methyltransferase [Lentilactobacillus parabuchneri]